MNKRPDWQTYYLGIADSVAVRADCTRRKVGAIVVRDNSIISTGYNGSPPGEPGCLTDGACPRGRHHKLLSGRVEVCACGNTWPCSVSVAPGSSYDTGAGACIALHAELNACVRAGERAHGATVYITEEPCDGCIKAMKSAGAAEAIWYGGRMDLCRKRPQPRGLRKLLARAAGVRS